MPLSDKHVLSCIHFFVHFMTSPTYLHRLFMASPLIPFGPYCSLSFWFSHFRSVTVSPMENKRDASVAGLGWPSTSNRGNPVTHPDASTIEAPAHTTDPFGISRSNDYTQWPRQLDANGHIFSSTSACCTFSDTGWLNLHGSSSRAFLLTCGSPDSLQDLYSFKQHQGVIHWRDPDIGNLQMPWSWTLFLWSLRQLIGSGLYGLRTIGAIILRFL